MKKILLALAIIGCISVSSANAMEAMKHDSKQGMEDGTKQEMNNSAQAMDHTNMASESQKMGDTFKHMAMVDGIHSEFQVMDLASMNMSDPDGNTHHVMATFNQDDMKITEAVGKVKIISPSGKEQLADLKDFGGGNFAASFKVEEDGKYGIICLFKDSKGKHSVKFWYPHMAI
ncbi:MAG: hypothetical protein OCC45_16270 [Desulfotalea sp.]